MIDLCPDDERFTNCQATIKVMGIGGAGSNAVNAMILKTTNEQVEFMIANTDAQALQRSPVFNKIQLGAKITKGLGAGSNPDLGRRAAEEDLDSITESIMHSDILFLTAGLGGGTGTGALPVIANAARELGVLTVAVVTKPFLFEGKRRQRFAEDTIKQLKNYVDTLIVVPNQRLLEVADSKISMLDAFSLSDSVLEQAISGISDIITKPGHINVDFADVKTIMKDMGMALMGTGRAQGEDRARKATVAAINSPLLENISITGAQGVLLNITGNANLGLYEINEAASMIYEMVNEDANIIIGSVIDENMNDEIMVTVIATGFEQAEAVQEKIYTHPVIVPSIKPTVKITPAINPEKPIEKITPQVVITTPKEEEPLQKIVTEPKELSFEQALAQLEKDEEEAQKKYNQVQAAEPYIDVNDLDTPTFLRKKIEEQQKNHSY